MRLNMKTRNYTFYFRDGKKVVVVKKYIYKKFLSKGYRVKREECVCVYIGGEGR
jgi:hypothetical protein